MRSLVTGIDRHVLLLDSGGKPRSPQDYEIVSPGIDNHFWSVHSRVVNTGIPKTTAHIPSPEQRQRLGPHGRHMDL